MWFNKFVNYSGDYQTSEVNSGHLKQIDKNVEYILLWSTIYDTYSTIDIYR